MNVFPFMPRFPSFSTTEREDYGVEGRVESGGATTPATRSSHLHSATVYFTATQLGHFTSPSAFYSDFTLSFS